MMIWTPISFIFQPVKVFSDPLECVMRMPSPSGPFHSASNCMPQGELISATDFICPWIWYPPPAPLLFWLGCPWFLRLLLFALSRGGCVIFYTVIHPTQSLLLIVSLGMPLRFDSMYVFFKRLVAIGTTFIRNYHISQRWCKLSKELSNALLLSYLWLIRAYSKYCPS